MCKLIFTDLDLIKWLFFHSFAYLFFSNTILNGLALNGIRHSLVARIAGSHPAGGGSIPPDGVDSFFFFFVRFHLEQFSIFFLIQTSNGSKGSHSQAMLVPFQMFALSEADF